MKRIIVLIAIITIALIVAIPVMAQTDPGSGYPVPEPQSVCCYDIEDNLADCDTYYAAHPEELCQDCPNRCEQSQSLVIVWFRRFVRWITSVFE